MSRPNEYFNNCQKCGGKSPLFKWFLNDIPSFENKKYYLQCPDCRSIFGSLKLTDENSFICCYKCGFVGYEELNYSLSEGCPNPDCPEEEFICRILKFEFVEDLVFDISFGE